MEFPDGVFARVTGCGYHNDDHDYTDQIGRVIGHYRQDWRKTILYTVEFWSDAYDLAGPDEELAWDEFYGNQLTLARPEEVALFLAATLAK